MKRALRGVLSCLTFLLLLGTCFASWASMPAMRIEAASKTPDGKVVVAGQSTSPSDATKTILVGRLNADGTVDATFGSGGWASYSDPSAATAELEVSALAIDPSGGIAVAARRDGQIELLRLDASGQPVLEFGGLGVALDTYSNSTEQVNALRFTTDGRLVAVGSVSGGAYSPTAMLLRYSPFGIRDPWFGAGPNGESIPGFFGGADSTLRAITPAPAPDTGFYAVGYARNWSPDKAMLLAKFFDDGTVDQSFYGVVDLRAGQDDEAFGVATDSQGRILVVGRDGNISYSNHGAPQSHFLIARFNGPYLDPYFSCGGGGIAAGDVLGLGYQDADSTPVSVIETASGQLDVLGTTTEVSTGRTHFAVWTYDPIFAPCVLNPTVANPIDVADDAMSAAFAAPDGELLALGTRESAQGDSGLRVRYFADDGSLDTDFAVDGPDDSANPISFYSVTEAEPAAESDQAFRVGGINVPVAISIAGGQYSLDCQSFTSADGIVSNGQRVCVRAFAATTPSTPTSVTVNVGPAVSASFTMTTGDVPDTGISPYPGNPGATATFYFGARAPHPATIYECALDGAPFASCPGGYKQYTGLADGTHTFAARVGNGWGMDPTPESLTWTVQIAPETTITASPATLSTASSASFSFASNDPNATFQCKLDGAAYAACAGPKTYGDLADGSHTFVVQAIALSGALDPTPASFGWTIDAVPPETSITVGTPANGALSSSTSASFSFSSSDAQLTGFECSLDGAPFAACTSPQTYSAITDGTHNFAVRAKSAAQVDATPATWSWTVDATAPETTISGTPAGVTNQTTTVITFSSGEPGSTFVCRRGGVPYTPCTSPVTLTNVPDGLNSFSVQAQDAAGNLDATPAYFTWTVDTVPPVTAISGAPSGVTSQQTASLMLSATDSPATFECQLDGAPFSACTSPVSLANLADGSHTFQARATDLAGNVDPTPASVSWTVDATAPDTAMSGAPAGTTTLRGASITLSSTESPASFECRLDAAAFAPCTSPVSLSNLADGSHTFEARARDSAGNVDASPASVTWTVDATAPDTSITSAPGGTVASLSAAIAFASNDTGASFECRIDGAPFAACTSPQAYSGLAQGTHVFDVRAVDSAGNVDATPASATWTADTVAPDTTITSGPQSLTQSSNARFTMAANESGASFTCRLDGGAWGVCDPNGYLYQNLGQGQHTFEAQATDAAGNTDPTPASQTWTIDYNYGPDTTITGGPSGTVNQSQATFTFTSSAAGSTFNCYWDGLRATCASPFTISGLADGSHTFLVAAVDPFGNMDTSPATVSWTVDTVSPDTTITAAPSGTVAQNSASVSFSASDPAATFECRLDGSAFAACASPAGLTGLADGTHTFDVRAKDSAGNLDASPASATWTVDTTAPNTTISSGPAASTNQTAATFQFDSGEAGDTYQCRLDGAAFSACSSPVSYAGLANGAHAFQVRATDPYGNVDPTPAGWNWTVDTVAPDTSITSGPSGRNNSSTATFGFSSTEANSTFQCKLDAASFVACASPATYSGLASGSHAFQVRSIDVAGNVDASPASRSWSVK